MTTMRRRFTGILTAAAMTTAMFTSAAFAAESITVEGTVNARGIEAGVNVETAIDMEAGAMSTTGTITVSGTPISFGEYFDSEKIMFQIPLLPSVLSYNYKAEPTGAITQYLPAELLSAVNEYTSLCWKTAFTQPDTEVLMNNLTAAVTDVLGSVEPTQLPAKDCLVADGTVSCEGMGFSLTGEQLGQLFDAILTASDGNGTSVGGSLASMAKIYRGFSLVSGQQGSDLSEAADMIDTLLSGGADMVASIGQFDVEIYANGDYPAEIDMTAQESTLKVQLAGPAETPYTNIIVSADGTEIAAFNCTFNGSGARLALSAQGTEVAALNLQADANGGKIDVIARGSLICSAQFAQEENGVTASLSAGDQTIASFSASGKTYTLDINAMPTLPLITGELLDNGFTVVCGDNANFTVTFGQTDAVVVPSGDVLNLESASAEDLQGLIGTVSALASALTGSVAAPAAQ